MTDDDARIWSSVRALLVYLHLLRSRSASHCTLDDFGQIPSPRRRGTIHDAIAEYAFYLRDCSEVERIALELDIVYPNMTIYAKPTQLRGTRGFRYTCRTRCLVMEEYGYPMSEQRYYDVLGDAYDRVRANMERAGVLEVTRWSAVA